MSLQRNQLVLCGQTVLSSYQTVYILHAHRSVVTIVCEVKRISIHLYSICSRHPIIQIACVSAITTKGYKEASTKYSLNVLLFTESFDGLSGTGSGTLDQQNLQKPWFRCRKQLFRSDKYEATGFKPQKGQSPRQQDHKFIGVNCPHSDMLCGKLRS
eukprot:2199058-Amphidinium_carterae.1